MLLNSIGTLLLIFPLHFAVAQSELGETESQTSTRARTAPSTSPSQLATELCTSKLQARAQTIANNPRGVSKENINNITTSLRNPDRIRNCEQGFMIGHTAYDNALNAVNNEKIARNRSATPAALTEKDFNTVTAMVFDQCMSRYGSKQMKALANRSDVEVSNLLYRQGACIDAINHRATLNQGNY